MNDPNSILSMTEHAGFVWPTYGIAAVVLIGIVVLSLRAQRRALRTLQKAEAEVIAGGTDDEA